jgi:anhydro-N-acetylmuramic acid kinase
MSGTSMDGVDVALIETDGAAHVVQGPSGFRPYSDPERRLLRAALIDARMLTDAISRPGILPQAEAFLTRAHAEAVETFVRDNGIKVLNIAGTRASKEPYVGNFVKQVLEDAFFPKAQGLIGGPDDG